MRLQCLVCKHEFEDSERFVTLTGQVSHKNSTGQGVSLAVCTKHLPSEMTEALLLNTAGWADHTHQVYAEHRIFDAPPED